MVDVFGKNMVLGGIITLFSLLLMHRVLTNHGRQKKQKYLIFSFVTGLSLITSFMYVVYRGESQQDLSKIAKNAIDISAFAASNIPDGTLVSLSGKTTTSRPIGNDFIEPGNYLKIIQKSEMFVWKQKSASNSKSTSNRQDSQVYQYYTTWSEQDPNTGNKRQDSRYKNPPKKIYSSDTQVSSFSIGNYTIKTSRLEIGVPENLILDREILVAQIPEKSYKIHKNYLYFGSKSPYFPTLGDERISFKVVPSGNQGTVFGALSGTTIIPYSLNGDQTLFQYYNLDRQESIKAQYSSYQKSVWKTRSLGYLMIFVGLLVLSSILQSSNSHSGQTYLKIGRILFVYNIIIANGLTITSIFLGNISEHPFLFLFSLFIIYCSIFFLLYQKSGSYSIYGIKDYLQPFLITKAEKGILGKSYFRR